MTLATALSRRSGLVAACSIALAALAGCGSMMSSSGSTFSATLEPSQEVPPTQSSGSGKLDATLDKSTGMLKWKLVYSGLTGPATMAHFHGPAMPGANAGVVVPFQSAASPVDGQAVLTASQVADLTAGKWYVNVHTQKYPAGEIRGQVMAK